MSVLSIAIGSCIGLIVALVVCPSLWALPMAMVERSRGRAVFRPSSYRSGLQIHLVAVAIFLSFIGFVMWGQLHEPGGVGSLALPMFLGLFAISWLLHKAAEGELERAYTKT